MTERQGSADLEPTALYEIRLRRTPLEPLRREFPTATVFTTRAETILFPQVEEPGELDELIDELLSRGVVLTEVHAVRTDSTSPVTPLDPPRKGGQPGDDDL